MFLSYIYKQGGKRYGKKCRSGFILYKYMRKINHLFTALSPFVRKRS